MAALLGNEQQVEPRAAVDLHLRYTASVIDNPGVIDSVEITGSHLDTVDETPKTFIVNGG